jgi:acyl carrier protein
VNIEEIITYLKEEIALAINQSSDFIDQDLNFLRLGISSIQTLKIINKIKKKLGIDINPVAMFEYKTISEFAVYLKDCMNESHV